MSKTSLMSDRSASNAVVNNSKNGGSPNYDSVDIPAKPPAEFTYHERRADLLQQVRDLGHPSMINQAEAAERYGVSQQQISKDLDRIAESVHEHVVDRDHRAFTVDSIVQRSIRGMLEDGEYRAAAKTAIEWDQWLTEFHDLEKLAEEVEQLKNQQERGY